MDYITILVVCFGSYVMYLRYTESLSTVGLLQAFIYFIILVINIWLVNKIPTKQFMEIE